jgi:glycosyltransferase involved in cell wall biosynthesis
VEPGKADALAAALSGALSNLSRLPAMGLAGRAMVETEFAWPIVVRKHLDMYSELVP